MACARSASYGRELEGEGLGDARTGHPGGLTGLSARGRCPRATSRTASSRVAEEIGGETLRDTITDRSRRLLRLPHPLQARGRGRRRRLQGRSDYGGPEYETVGAFGSNCGVDDLRAVSKANEICNAYSLDTIAAGMAVSFAMECFENGLLTHRRHRRAGPELWQRQGDGRADAHDRRARGAGRPAGRGHRRCRGQDRRRGGEVRDRRQGPALPDARVPHAPRAGAGLCGLAHRRRPHAQHLG